MPSSCNFGALCLTYVGAIFISSKTIPGEIQMRKFITFGLIFVSLLFFCDTSQAQDKAFQAAVLQKFDDLENRLNKMDKRFEIRFAKLEERMNTLEIKIDAVNQRLDDRFNAVNQRIDDKFNLIIGLLTILVAILALPSVPKLLERFKAPPQRKEDIQRLEKQIEQINTQLAQLTQAMRPAP